MFSFVIDLKILRDNPDLVRASQRKRGEDEGLVDALLTADATRRHAIVEADGLRAEQKALGRQVGKASGEEKAALLARGKELAEQVKAAVARQNEAGESSEAAHRSISNIVADDAPAGGEDDFIVLEHVGEPRQIDDPKDHLELGESLGLIDMKRGTKVSGSPALPVGEQSERSSACSCSACSLRAATRCSASCFFSKSSADLSWAGTSNSNASWSLRFSHFSRFVCSTKPSGGASDALSGIRAGSCFENCCV